MKSPIISGFFLSLSYQAEMTAIIQFSANQNKREAYESLLPQLKGLLKSESDMIANMANLSAALKEAFAWWWVGFYLVKENQLVLGPFQGPVACTRIDFGNGVCGKAWEERKSMLVPDVNKFPGHIACSVQSVAEIVIPLTNANGDVFAVLDIDSEKFDVLDEVDVEYLEKIVCLL